MNSFKKVLLVFMFLILTLTILSACAGPRLVVGSTGRQGVVKFIWDDRDEQGLIKCDVAQNGALSNCRSMSIELKE